MITKETFESIVDTILAQHAQSDSNKQALLRGVLPPNFPLSHEELAQQLKDIFFGTRKLPDVVTSINDNYEDHRKKLITTSPVNYDPVCVQKAISELRLSIEKEDNDTKMRKMMETRLEELSLWLEHLEQHQEDAVYLTYPTSYAALWFTDGNIFALRHARGGTYSVIELDKTVARGLLTNRALNGTRYRSDRFAVIRKYDLRETMESTTYVKIRKVGQGKWVAMDKDGHVAQMSDAWARSTDNVPHVSYIEAVSRYKTGDKRPVILIPGSSRLTVNLATNKLVETHGLPLLAYTNKPGEHLCMVAALTSALHYLGYPELCQRIHTDLEQEVVPGQDFVNWFLTRVVNKNLLTYGMQLVKNNRRNRYNPNMLEQHIREKEPQRLVLGKLRGRNGGINHAVAFVNDTLIFDANHKRAMLLTSESLDIACDGTGYCSLYWSYRLVTKN